MQAGSRVTPRASISMRCTALCLVTSTIESLRLRHYYRHKQHWLAQYRVLLIDIGRKSDADNAASLRCLASGRMLFVDVAISQMLKSQIYDCGRIHGQQNH